MLLTNTFQIEKNLESFICKHEKLRESPNLEVDKRKEIKEMINDLKNDRLAFNNSNLEESDKNNINTYIDAKIKVYEMQKPSKGIDFSPLYTWYPISLILGGLAIISYTPIPPLVGTILFGIGGVLLTIRLVCLAVREIYLELCQDEANMALDAIKQSYANKTILPVKDSNLNTNVKKISETFNENSQIEVLNTV